MLLIHRGRLTNSFVLVIFYFFCSFEMYSQKDSTSIISLEEWFSNICDTSLKVRYDWAYRLPDAQNTEIDILFKGIEHKDPFVRRYCANALGEYKLIPEESISMLLNLLSDSVETVRNSATYSLIRFGKQAAPRLIEHFSKQLAPYKTFKNTPFVNKGNDFKLCDSDTCSSLSVSIPSYQAAVALSEIKDPSTNRKIYQSQYLDSIYTAGSNYPFALFIDYKNPFNYPKIIDFSKNIKNLGPDTLLTALKSVNADYRHGAIQLMIKRGLKELLFDFYKKKWEKGECIEERDLELLSYAGDYSAKFLTRIVKEANDTLKIVALRLIYERAYSPAELLSEISDLALNTTDLHMQTQAIKVLFNFDFYQIGDLINNLLEKKLEKSISNLLIQLIYEKKANDAVYSDNDSIKELNNRTLHNFLQNKLLIEDEEPRYQAYSIIMSYQYFKTHSTIVKGLKDPSLKIRWRILKEVDADWLQDSVIINSLVVMLEKEVDPKLSCEILEYLYREKADREFLNKVLAQICFEQYNFLEISEAPGYYDYLKFGIALELWLNKNLQEAMKLVHKTSKSSDAKLRYLTFWALRYQLFNTLDMKPWLYLALDDSSAHIRRLGVEIINCSLNDLMDKQLVKKTLSILDNQTDDFTIVLPLLKFIDSIVLLKHLNTLEINLPSYPHLLTELSKRRDLGDSLQNLLVKLAFSENADIQSISIKNLHSSNLLEVRNRLTKQLFSSSANKRRVGILGLIALKDPDPKLLNQLQDIVYDKLEVRKHAPQFIFIQTDSSNSDLAVDYLNIMLEDKESEVLKSAMYYLSNLELTDAQIEKTQKHLLQLIFKDSNELIHPIMLLQIGKNPARSYDAVSQLSQHPDSSIQSQIPDLLKKIQYYPGYRRSSATTTTLIQLTNHPNLLVRGSAYKMLDYSKVNLSLSLKDSILLAGTLNNQLSTLNSDERLMALKYLPVFYKDTSSFLSICQMVSDSSVEIRMAIPQLLFSNFSKYAKSDLYHETFYHLLKDRTKKIIGNALTYYKVSEETPPYIISVMLKLMYHPCQKIRRTVLVQIRNQNININDFSPGLIKEIHDAYYDKLFSEKKKYFNSIMQPIISQVIELPIQLFYKDEDPHPEAIFNLSACSGTHQFEKRHEPDDLISGGGYQFEKRLMDELKPLPDPLPQASTKETINPALLGNDSDTLGTIHARMKEALINLGYEEFKLFKAEGGFAMVTQLERMSKTGETILEDRFGLKKSTPMNFFDYIEKLINSSPGYHRLFLFIVTTKINMDDSGESLNSMEEANLFFAEGGTNLPPAIKEMPYKDRNVHVLIYQFEKKNGYTAILKSGNARPGAIIQLQKSGILKQFSSIVAAGN